MSKDMETIEPGTWVRVQFTLLESGERAPGLPADTAATPYVVRVSGRLQEAAVPGEDATVITQIGRRVRGTLTDVNPGHWHTFGETLPALQEVGDYIHTLQRTLREER